MAVLRIRSIELESVCRVHCKHSVVDQRESLLLVNI